MTTIGVDFRFKTVTSNNRNVKLQIWDTAGQERFRTITNTYYKSSISHHLGAHAVFLVYDITNSESFESINNFWLNEVESYADPGAVLVLIGTSEIIFRQQIRPSPRTNSTHWEGQRTGWGEEDDVLLDFSKDCRPRQWVFYELDIEDSSWAGKKPSQKEIDVEPQQCGLGSQE